MKIMNAMEPIVINLFEQYFKPISLNCDCDKCRLDIILLTLNHLQPRYTSSQSGEALVKAIFMEPQLQSDVLKEITKAVSVIAENPLH
ncbi:late competence development ComFB family protein [Paenibacillus sp. sgz302251]|uniref:late competence development ComFB family protein n=1 Tax=Paenibacillus sp. sgz302251 TaxID=3414493 RepID=UPI003C7D190D